MLVSWRFVKSGWPILAGFLLAGGWPPAAQALTKSERAARSDGIKGLVVNQTISSNGYAYYLIFSELWRDKPDGEDYELNIVERPSRRYGNQILVYYGQRRVFSGHLPFKYALIRPECEKAVEESYAAIIAMKMEESMTGDPDVGKEEL